MTGFKHVVNNQNNTFNDESLINDEINDMMDENEEDYEFYQVINYRCYQGRLIFNINLTSGKIYEALFSMITRID